MQPSGAEEKHIMKKSKWMSKAALLLAIVVAGGIAFIAGSTLTKRVGLDELAIPEEIIGEVSLGSSAIPVIPAQFEGVITGTHVITDSNGVEEFDIDVWYDEVDELVALVQTSSHGYELVDVYANGVLTVSERSGSAGADVRVKMGTVFDVAVISILGPIALAFGDVYGDPAVLDEKTVSGVLVQRLDLGEFEFDPEETGDSLWVFADSRLPIRRASSGMFGEVFASKSESWSFDGYSPGTILASDLPQQQLDPETDSLYMDHSMGYEDLSEFTLAPVYTAGQSVGDYEFYTVEFSRQAGKDAGAFVRARNSTSELIDFASATYIYQGEDFTSQIRIDTRPADQALLPAISNANDFSAASVGELQGVVNEQPNAVMLVFQIGDAEVVIVAPTRQLADLAASQLVRANP